MAKHPRNHEEKMCALTCCSCALDLKKIARLSSQPKYICESCARVANDKKNLCMPKTL